MLQKNFSFCGTIKIWSKLKRIAFKIQDKDFQEFWRNAKCENESCTKGINYVMIENPRACLHETLFSIFCIWWRQNEQKTR